MFSVLKFKHWIGVRYFIIIIFQRSIFKTLKVGTSKVSYNVSGESNVQILLQICNNWSYKINY